MIILSARISIFVISFVITVRSILHSGTTCLMCSVKTSSSTPNLDLAERLNKDHYRHASP